MRPHGFWFHTLTVSEPGVAMIAVGRSQVELTGRIDLSRAACEALGAVVVTRFAVTWAFHPFLAMRREWARALFGLLIGGLIAKVKLPTLTVTARRLNIPALKNRIARFSLRLIWKVYGAGMVAR